MSGSSTPLPDGGRSKGGRSEGRIRPARTDEAELLSDLARRSKAHWGYTQDQMAIFAGELTLTRAELSRVDAYVLETDAGVEGFYTLRPADRYDATAELEHLFVEPARLRRGVGRRLWEHALEHARARGYRAVVIQSDPHAEAFYAALGAEKLRDVPTSIPGRTLPLMRRIL